MQSLQEGTSPKKQVMWVKRSGTGDNVNKDREMPGDRKDPRSAFHSAIGREAQSESKEFKRKMVVTDGLDKSCRTFYDVFIVISPNGIQSSATL